MEFVTQRVIAEEIGKAYSTVSYYISRFPQFFPHNGKDGQQRRYTKEAIEVARVISQMKGERMDDDQVERALLERFPVVIESSMNQQQDNNTNLMVPQKLFEVIESLVERSEEQQQCINELEEQIKELESENKIFQESILKKLEEAEQEIERLRSPKPSFWQRLFGRSGQQ